MISGVFIDRDGVININRSDYVKSWNEFSFENGVLSSLKRLAKSQYAIVIISNQSAIGRGFVNYETIDMIHKQMLEQITNNGGRVDGIYYCPHTPSDNCECRKPKPGLLLMAAQELGIDLSKSFFIGDAICDVEAALAAGCLPLFVQTGLGNEQLDKLREKEFSCVKIFGDLGEAVDFVLSFDSELAWKGLKL